MNGPKSIEKIDPHTILKLVFKFFSLGDIFCGRAQIPSSLLLVVLHVEIVHSEIRRTQIVHRLIMGRIDAVNGLKIALLLLF